MVPWLVDTAANINTVNVGQSAVTENARLRRMGPWVHGSMGPLGTLRLVSDTQN